MNVDDLVDAINNVEPSQILVARALDPALRAGLAESIEFVELPFVRGRTVIPAGVGEGDVVVAGNPNFLGVYDSPDVPTWIAVPGRETPQVDPAPTVELARNLAQLPGVTVPFPPESAVVIALFPIDPATLGLTPLSAYPELPGGARIEIDPALDPRQYAAELSDRLEDGWKRRQGR